jgi:hypothetical protein
MIARPIGNRNGEVFLELLGALHLCHSSFGKETSCYHQGDVVFLFTTAEGTDLFKNSLHEKLHR